MFTFKAGEGTCATKFAGLSKGAITFHCDRFSVASNVLKWAKKGKVYAAEFAGCRLMVSVDGGAVAAGVANDSDEPVFLKEIALALGAGKDDSPLVAEEWFEFIHQANFGGFGGAKKVGLANRWMDHNHESAMVYVLKEIGTDRSVLFGATRPYRGDLVNFKAAHDAPHLEGRFGVSIKSVQKRQVNPGDEAWTSAVSLATGDDPLALLEAYGDGFRVKRKRPFKPVQTGWNSWDYFSGTVSSKDMFDNMKTARKKFGDKVRCLVIDEGWEPRWGDWIPNWKFPEGLKGYCETVKAAGMVPGIWTAPTMVNRYTKLYRQHPEWFALAADGQVARDSYSYGPMSFLDVTHPEARQWLFDLFKRLRAEGFEYFKVDFTQETLKAEKFHDPTVPRGQVIRTIFETVRAAIGDDAYLLACGAPFETVTDLVDAARVSGDIHNFWSHVLRNVSCIASRWWQHRRLWNNDPDFAIARSRQTATNKDLNAVTPFAPHEVRHAWMKGRELNQDEVAAYLLFLWLSAGELFLSDDLPGLKDNAIAMLKKILERPLREAARPLDLFDSHEGLPSLYLAKEKDFSALGVFNWEEDKTEFTIQLKELGLNPKARVRDFWTDKPVRVENGALTVTLPPRRSLGFVIE